MKIVALAGGVGGAKLAQGLARSLDSDELSIIVNTGDDFEFLGLNISPDLDTVCYTLANLANMVTGWGLEGDTFNFMEKIRQMGEPDWFRLGDCDLATHIIRTHKLTKGETLTSITEELCKSWSIRHRILPMSDEPVRTMVDTVELGVMPFQEYFVKYQFEPAIKGISFEGIEKAKPTQPVLKSLELCDAVVICPSNPFVSIDPVLSLNGIKTILKEKFVIAVSPLIGNKAIKGPLAKMFIEMNIEPTVGAIADHYREFLDCLFIHDTDVNEMPLDKRSCIISKATNILLPDIDSRMKLAAEIVEFIKENQTKNK